MPSIGGVLPPPSQCANRNLNSSSVVCAMSFSSAQHTADETAHRIVRLLPAAFQIAAKQLPEIDVRRGIQRDEAGFAFPSTQRLELRGERDFQPLAMRLSPELESAMHQCQLVFRFQRADIEVTNLLVLIQHAGDRGLDITRR